MNNNITYIKTKITALLLAAALIVSSFAVLPATAFAASSSDIQVGDFVDVGNENAAGYTGVPHWRVIDKADDGSLLLMSEYLWKGNGTDNASVGIKFNTATGLTGQTKEINGQVFHWRGTAAETWCDNFYDAVLKDVEGLTVKPTTVSDLVYTYTQTLYSAGNNKQIYFAEAKSVLYQNKVFFLSAEDIAGYEDTQGYLENPADRVAKLPGSDAACEWLLRSTQDQTNWASEVKADGEIAAVTANRDGRAARPVFWAQFANDTPFVSEVDESGAKTWKIGEEPSDPAVDAVTEKINALPDSDMVTTADKAKIEAAKAAYDALTDEQKAKVNEDALQKLNDNVAALEKAEKDSEGKTGNDTSAADKASADKEAAAQKAAEEKAKATTSVEITSSTVNAATIQAAIAAAGGRPEYVTELVIGKKVRKISKKAFAGTKVNTLIVKSKKLKKKSVKGSLKGSAVKTIKVKVGKAKTNKKFVKKYKKIFTKKNAGKKVKVKK